MNDVPVGADGDPIDAQAERQADPQLGAAGEADSVRDASAGDDASFSNSAAGSTTPRPVTAGPFGAEAYRDERYRFQGFSQDFLIGLGRLSLGASYLEGTIATMLWRLINNDDLRLGRRLTADMNFRWLVDHTRAVSEHRLPPELHARLADWLARSQRAYGDRNRILLSTAREN